MNSVELPNSAIEQSWVNCSHDKPYYASSWRLSPRSSTEKDKPNPIDDQV